MNASEIKRRARSLILGVVLAFSLPPPNFVRAKEAIGVAVDWTQVIATSQTAPSVLAVGVPLLRHESPFRAAAFGALRTLAARKSRYIFFNEYPRLAVAELEPPSRNATSWDFSLIDPEMNSFLEATKGLEPVVVFDAIPAWMFNSKDLIAYPINPDEQFWSFRAQGTRLLDQSGRQVAQYFARIVSWYTRGGFTDENGVYHRSGHHYDLPWWGVLYEPDFFYGLNPEQYTLLYDRIVGAIRKVSPTTKFVGLSLSAPGSSNPAFFEYFLNPKHHRTGIPLDRIAYHFYVYPSLGQNIEAWQYTFFDRADGFLEKVHYIDAIRKRLSPATSVSVEDIASMLPEDTSAAYGGPPMHSSAPDAYWNLSAALYAYLYAGLATADVDSAGQAQLVAYPNNYPSTTLLNWDTGAPNSRFRVLQLIQAHLGPGDKVVSTALTTVVPLSQDVAVQGFVTPKGKRLLIINKRNWSTSIDLTKIGRIDRIEVVDEESGGQPPRTELLDSPILPMAPFAVAVVTVY